MLLASKLQMEVMGKAFSRDINHFAVFFFPATGNPSVTIELLNMQKYWIR